MKIPLS